MNAPTERAPGSVGASGGCGGGVVVRAAWVLAAVRKVCRHNVFVSGCLFGVRDWAALLVCAS